MTRQAPVWRPALATLVALAALIAPLAAPLAQAPSRDTLTLASMQRAAIARDPRQQQIELQRRRTSLRLESIAAERLPSLSAQGQAQYQSDVTSIPLRQPGVSVPTPPHDTWDARVEAQEPLYDPSRAPRRAVERAQLAQNEATLRSTVYPLRKQVNQAFFGAALLQARADELATAIASIDAQLSVAEARVAAGTALPSESAALRAELLRRRQDADGVSADRQAALAVLAQLTGERIGEEDAIAIPDLAAEVAAVRAASESPRGRPEFEQFERSRDLLEAQEGVVAARTRPRLSAFARAGYGKPGLDFLQNRFDSYWLGGVQVQWAPWTWGTTARERETIALQREIVRTEEAAFAEAVRRSVASDLATMDRLERALATDDEIIALRERVAREARVRFGEGVLTSADWVNRQNEVLDARLARATHRVQLAQARAHYLTTLGIEVR